MHSAEGINKMVKRKTTKSILAFAGIVAWTRKQETERTIWELRQVAADKIHYKMLQFREGINRNDRAIIQDTKLYWKWLEESCNKWGTINECSEVRSGNK